MFDQGFVGSLPVLKRAVKAVIGQHAMFRARFSTSSDGTWQQKTAAGSIERIETILTLSNLWNHPTGIGHRVNAELERFIVKAVIGQHAMFRARFSTSSDGTWQQKTAAVGSLQASGALERVRALEVEPLDRRECETITRLLFAL
jgi:hypothetical protein